MYGNLQLDSYNFELTHAKLEAFRKLNRKIFKSPLVGKKIEICGQLDTSILKIFQTIHLMPNYCNYNRTDPLVKIEKITNYKIALCNFLLVTLTYGN